MSLRAGLVVLAVLASAPAAGDDAAILYLDAAGWRAASPERRLALASAFMRIFCTDLRMPASALADCLDRDGGSGPVLDRALACNAALSRP
ncbi:hypothetical protein [Methylobacterium oryzihabitans]|uniref:UrcA family protein n=1 Tax=Methylobacterium oryzihabitans TaxID=2499852 RepID=A0A3S3U8M2_9HYPH|nr:hypothetical protein [Methylobacterium oryzihabitans]RVU18114.1 hypothetical protein EOE48_12030 [Methylobacterium oryzihabitans]